jgi:hypothetical protein
MTFAITAEVRNPRLTIFHCAAAKTRYGGKLIREGDVVYVFASENEAGAGLVASSVVTSAEAVAKKRGVARQTPRVSISVRRLRSAAS